MTQRQQALSWAGAILVAFILLYVLRSVLLPFVAGMAIAYLLDPIADRLERHGLGRTFATLIITVVFCGLVALALVLILPVLAEQIVGFFGRVPGYLDQLRDNLMPWLQEIAARFGINLKTDVKDALNGKAGEAVNVVEKLLLGLLGGGQAVFDMLSVAVITPVVAFYLLRDWDRMVARLDDLLPRRQAPTIRRLAQEVDKVLAGFVRGQMMVCLALGTIYGGGLTLVGVEFGLAIGMVAGIASFIPYVGSILGFVSAMLVALVQFWPDWIPVALVVTVFGVGQFLEGNVLTPKLVGDRIGLHPVWIMFGLLAGGALFGFVGLLIAVPVCAVIGVLVRFGIGRYRESYLYHGTLPPPSI